MATCSACVFYLCFRTRGYNCGFLIKRVKEEKDACPHYKSAVLCPEERPSEPLSQYGEGRRTF